MSNQEAQTATEAAAPAAAENPLTPAQIDELKAQAAKAAEHWDRLLRLTADLDNYKKQIGRAHV